jgi:hypothetical protein
MLQEKAITTNYYGSNKNKELLMETSWRNIVRPAVANEASLQRILYRSIKKRYKSASIVVRDAGTANAISFVSRQLFDNSVFDPLMKMYYDVAMYYARRTYFDAMNRAKSQHVGLRVPIEWKSTSRFNTIWRSALQSFLQMHGARFVSEINETTRKDLLAILQRGQSANISERQIAQFLVSSGIPMTRASRIARTETTRALNAGILLGGATLPFEMSKEWITAEDERVRGKPFSHTQLHGTIIPLSQSFNNGEDIRFPGDPLASAENVINCRCVLSMLPNLDSSGRPIYRPSSPLDTDILMRLTDLM